MGRSVPKIQKPTTRMKPSVRREPPNTTVVVVAQGMFDDVPLRVFTGATPRAEAKDWAERLSKSAAAVDDTVATLCKRMGWTTDPRPVGNLRLVCFRNGIPDSILADFAIAVDGSAPERTVSYDDV